MRIKHCISSAACVLLFASGLLLNGCGSGSHTNSGTVYPLSARTRALQVGDSWTYDNGDTETIAPSVLNGIPAPTQIFGYAAGDGNFGYSVKYFAQNAAHEVIYLGRRGENSSAQTPDDPTREVQSLTVPQTVLFGTWAQGAKRSFTLRYTSDAPFSPAGEDATLTIVGTEKIKTPLGTFDTWKVEAQPNNPTYNFQIKGTYWYAPQLGVYIRAHEVTTGFEIHDDVTRTLVKTNVPLAP